MDRYWESSDGYTVSSRQIRTPLGTVEHLAIERIGGGDIPWAVKQKIKDELFGSRAVAIEVYPAKKEPRRCGRYISPLGAAEAIPASVRYSSYPRSAGNSCAAWI